MEFKVGDRVKILHNSVWAGPGTVISVSPEESSLKSFYRVVRDESIDTGSKIGHFMEKDLEYLVDLDDEIALNRIKWEHFFNGVTGTKE